MGPGDHGDAPGPASRFFPGEWHFGWILGGRAIQDVITVASEQGVARNADGQPLSVGTTLRAYDQALDAWWVTWMCPADREFSTLLARRADHGIVLDGQWRLGPSDGRRFRWSFSEIGPDRFRWHGNISTDDGQTWQLVEEMQARRL